MSENFARLYGCFNGTNPGGAGLTNPIFTGTSTFLGPLTFGNGLSTAITVGTRSLAGDGWGEAIVLRENSGHTVTLQAHDGALYVTTDDRIGFGGTSLAISAFTKRGVTQQKVLVGPENSGGIGYRMLRVVN